MAKHGGHRSGWRVFSLFVGSFALSLMLGGTWGTVSPARAGTSERGMFGPDRRVVPLDRRLALYRQFGVRWVRINASIGSSAEYMTGIGDAPAYRRAGYKLLLSVSYPPIRAGARALDNPATYTDGLSNLIDRVQPTAITVENEIDNPPYHIGASAYLAQLAAACSVAQARGVTCIDSGLTPKRVIAFAVADAIKRRNLVEARWIAGAATPWIMGAPQGQTNLGTLAQFAKVNGAAEATQIITGAKGAGATALNLHWYCMLDSLGAHSGKNSALLGRVAEAMRRASGLSLFGGEVGFEARHRADIQIKADEVAACLGSLDASGTTPLILWNPGASNFYENLAARSIVSREGIALPSSCGLVSGTLKRPTICSSKKAVRQNRVTRDGSKSPFAER